MVLQRRADFAGGRTASCVSGNRAQATCRGVRMGSPIPPRDQILPLLLMLGFAVLAPVHDAACVGSMAQFVPNNVRQQTVVANDRAAESIRGKTKQPNDGFSGFTVLNG